MRHLAALALLAVASCGTATPISNPADGGRRASTDEVISAAKSAGVDCIRADRITPPVGARERAVCVGGAVVASLYEDEAGVQHAVEAQRDAGQGVNLLTGLNWTLDATAAQLKEAQVVLGGQLVIEQPTATPTEAPAATAAPTPDADAYTRNEGLYLAAMRKAEAKYLEDGEDIDEADELHQGRVACGLEEGDMFGSSGPPDVQQLIEGELDQDTYRYAIKYLCPKYLPIWRKAQGGFADGTYTVGKDIKPGTYRTLARPVSDCYWERSNSGGDTIANDFVTNAPRGVTVTIYRGEGFTSQDCGDWIHV